MHRRLHPGLIVLFLAVIFTIGFCHMSQPVTAQPVKAPATKLLRHIVLFKFKESATKEQVQEVADAFAALPKQIDAIVDFEWGLDNSPEGKADGFTHGFVVTFRDEKGREIYLPHPAHQEFVKLVGPRLEKVLVFDYWTKP